jgi:hypothetical protein
VNIRLLPAIAVLALAVQGMPAPRAADVPREMHGSADTFTDPGMALAWGVLRGADEDSTLIVVRIATDPTVYSDVGVSGGDPFTQDRKVMLATTSSAGTLDVRTPRAHFARFPRTELRFYAPGAATRTPSLLVFYLGVPDTTPEFADPAKLDAYLRDRIAKLRGSER